MIKKITLENFQSHKKTELELSPGVNTIIGTSDSGKSAVLRALELLLFNRPGGDAFVSDWIKKDGKPTDNAVVTIETERGVVKRIKGKDNTYEVNGESLGALGRGGIPENITDVININEINFQTQADNFFLFKASSGEVAKTLNKYVDLELLDTMMSNGDSAVRQLTSLVKDYTGRMVDAREKLDALSFVDDLDEKVTVAESLEEEILDTHNKFDVVLSVLNKIITIDNKLYDLGKILSLDDYVGNLVKESKSIESGKQEFENLANKIETYKKVVDDLEVYNYVDSEKDIEVLTKDADELVSMKKSLVTLESIITHLEGLKESPLCSVSLSRIDNVYTGLQKQKESLELLSESIDSYQKVCYSVDRGNELVLAKESALQEYVESLDGICPLCGNPIGGCND